MSDIRTCSNCRAKYIISSYHTMFRDKDSIDCQKCGKELMHWNGSEVFTATLIEPIDKDCK